MVSWQYCSGDMLGEIVPAVASVEKQTEFHTLHTTNKRKNAI